VIAIRLKGATQIAQFKQWPLQTLAENTDQTKADKKSNKSVKSFLLCLADFSLMISLP